MINTQPLIDAAFDAKKRGDEYEMQLCRDLVTSIQDRSPEAFKFHYNGEAEQCMSENALSALNEVLSNAAKYGARIRSRARWRLNLGKSPIQSQKKRTRSTGKGVSICEPRSGDELKPRVSSEKKLPRVEATSPCSNNSWSTSKKPSSSS